MSKLVTISGCSGGGKTTLLLELQKRGYATVPEPGRRIVVDQQKFGGDILPWINPEAFVRQAMVMALGDLQNHPNPKGWVFFDRGLVDAASALASYTTADLSEYLEGQPGYHRTAFLVPPWPEIYETDNERQHDLSEALEEYDRLLLAFPAAGYEIVVLDKTSVGERADQVLEQLDDATKSDLLSVPRNR